MDVSCIPVLENNSYFPYPSFLWLDGQYLRLTDLPLLNSSIRARLTTGLRDDDAQGKHGDRLDSLSRHQLQVMVRL